MEDEDDLPELYTSRLRQLWRLATETFFSSPSLSQHYWYNWPICVGPPAAFSSPCCLKPTFPADRCSS